MEYDVLISGKINEVFKFFGVLQILPKDPHVHEIEKALSLLIPYRKHGIIVVLCLLTQSLTRSCIFSCLFFSLFFLYLDVDCLCLVAVDCFGLSLDQCCPCFFLEVELVMYNGASAEIFTLEI